jgi:uncharacterized protein GlcG (DUF336 family)
VARGALAAVLAVAAVGLLSCGGDTGKGGLQIPSQDQAGGLPQLEAGDVRAIMQSSARAIDSELVVAVTDRRGVILGVGTTFNGGFDFEAQCASLECPLTDIPLTREPGASAASDCEAVELAVQLARTAAFFSARQTPLTSRSVRFISGEHFPPGIKNSGAAALFGIENTNRGCSFDAASRPVEDQIPRGRSLSAVLRDIRGGEPLACESSDDPADQCGCSRGIATLPGGVPIYKGVFDNTGKLAVNMVGGVGVALRGLPLLPDRVAAFEELLPDTDPHASNAVLRREFDDLRTADAQPFQLGEFAARAYAGDRAGFPILHAEGIQDVCNNPAITRPTCCSPNPSRCFFNVLPGTPPIPFDPVIFIDGIEVPEVNFNPSIPPGAGTFNRDLDYIIDPIADTDPDDPNRSARPVPSGNLNLDENRNPGTLTDYLVDPTDASDSPAGAAPLSAQEVADIIQAGVENALKIRGGIRLPLEARTAMVLAVSDTNGKLLALYRMPDATVFSIDVAVAKSRNVNYFSSLGIDPIDTMDCPGAADCRGVGIPPGTAVTNRTISFGAQPFFPSGIEGHLRGFDEPYEPGPYRRVFLEDSANPCTNGREPRNGRQNGIVFFPGSTPIYKNGVLVGGYGVSGDGVEQDDIVSFGGARNAASGNFLPDPGIRADQVSVRSVRLPYLKFNRAPDQ